MEQDYFNLCNRQFDAEFDKIEGLARYPWVGSKFADSDCRPLILGESHYAVNDDGSFSEEEYGRFGDKGYSRVIFENVIRDKCKCESTWPMYEGLLKTFMEVSPDNIKAFWSKIAFYNFIQSVMKSKVQRPKEEDVVEGWKAFAEVIKLLQPTLVLFFGFCGDYYKGALNGTGVEIDLIEDRENKVGRYIPRIGNLFLSDKVIPVKMIKHPSSYYNHNLWREYLEKRDPQMMAYLAK